VLLVAAIATRGPATRLIRRLGLTTVTTDVAADEQSPHVVATTPGELLLQLRGVESSYGAVRVLDGVDLDLRAGEVHALIGPNGSGKSTALRVAAGVVRAGAGEVLIQSSFAPTAIGAAERVRAGVARTLQRTVSLGELSVAMQVAVGARARERSSQLGLRELLRTPEARRIAAGRACVVGDAVQLVGLSGRTSLPMTSLDTAEQRLLQLARAVATGAPALLVDEPAAGMSAEQRRRLGDVLRALADSGRGVLLVEHDLRLVGRVADRVTVLAEGRVLASGSPDDVRRDEGVRRAYLGGPAL
jgi:branched-chain amino acid transport system permease protein